jgi:hypothetical protein
VVWTKEAPAPAWWEDRCDAHLRDRIGELRARIGDIEDVLRDAHMAQVAQALRRELAGVLPPARVAGAALVEAVLGRGAAGAARNGFEDVLADWGAPDEASTFTSEWLLKLDEVRRRGTGWEARQYVTTPFLYIRDTVCLLADVLEQERRHGTPSKALSLRVFCERARHERYADRLVARMSPGRHQHLIGEIKQDFAWKGFGWGLLRQMAGRILETRPPPKRGA